MGIDHVGLGTDTKLTPASGGGRGGGRGPQGNPDGPQDPNARGRSDDAPIGRGGQGPGRGGVRVSERTNEAWQGLTVGFYFAVVDAMLKAGFTPEEIGKVGGGNFLRVYDAATTVTR